MKPGAPMQNSVEPIYDVMPIPDELVKPASLYVCEQAYDVDDARELLEMLGLVPDGEQ